MGGRYAPCHALLTAAEIVGTGCDRQRSPRWRRFKKVVVGSAVRHTTHSPQLPILILITAWRSSHWRTCFSATRMSLSSSASASLAVASLRSPIAHSSARSPATLRHELRRVGDGDLNWIGDRAEQRVAVLVVRIWLMGLYREQKLSRRTPFPTLKSAIAT